MAQQDGRRSVGQGGGGGSEGELPGGQQVGGEHQCSPWGDSGQAQSQSQSHTQLQRGGEGSVEGQRSTLTVAEKLNEN